LKGDLGSRAGAEDVEDEEWDDWNGVAESPPLAAASTPNPAINSRREKSDRIVLSPGSCGGV
jgi:hypothetical protein